MLRLQALGIAKACLEETMQSCVNYMIYRNEKKKRKNRAIVHSSRLAATFGHGEPGALFSLLSSTVAAMLSCPLLSTMLEFPMTILGDAPLCDVDSGDAYLGPLLCDALPSCLLSFSLASPLWIVFFSVFFSLHQRKRLCFCF